MEEAAPAIPTAADLSGRFRIELAADNGGAMSESDVLIEGDAKGAVVTKVTQSKKERKFSRHTFDAAGAAKLLGALDKLQWWKLGNEAQTVTDGTQYALKIRRGGFRHQLAVDNGCACSAAGKCGCPQLELIRLVAGLPGKLPAKSQADFPAPKKMSFKAPKVDKSQRMKGSLACEPGPNGVLGCDRWRCFPQGKALACFVSPFAKGVLTLPGPRVAPLKDRKEATDYYWALQLADGKKCFAQPLPTKQVSWSCATEDAPEATVKAVIRTGKGLMAVLRDSELKVSLVTQVWP